MRAITENPRDSERGASSSRRTVLKGAVVAAGAVGAAAIVGSETVFSGSHNAPSQQPRRSPRPRAGHGPAARIDLGAPKYGAKGDGSDDSAALSAWRDDIFGALDGGANGVHATVPCGIFAFGGSVTLDILADNVHLEGDSRGGSVVTQLNGVNADVITTRGYHAGHGPTSGFSVTNLTLDGNGAEQTAPGWCCLIRGYNYDIETVDLLHGSGGGLFSQFTDTGVAKYQEARIRGLGCHEYTGITGSDSPTYGILWAGPHDSQFSDLILSTLAADQPDTGPSYGFVQAKGASAEYVTNMHVWGRHHYGIWADQQANGIHLANVVAEGALAANTVLSSGSTWTGGEVYGTADAPGGTGISFGIGRGAGDAPRAAGLTDGFACAGAIVQAVRAYAFVAPGSCVDLTNSAGGNVLTAVCATLGRDARAALYRGSPHPDDDIFLTDPSAAVRLIQRLSAS